MAAKRASLSISPEAERRAKLIRAVHAAARQHGLCAEDRHAIQTLVVPGKASLTAMDAREIGLVLDRLNRGTAREEPLNKNPRPLAGKVRALWWTLYWIGAVESPSDAALDAFILRQTGVARLAFLDHGRAPSVIEALKDWAARAGVVWPSKERLALLSGAQNPGLTLARLERHAVLAALWAQLSAAGLTRALSPYPLLEQTLGLSPNHWAWDDRSLDEGIRILGKKCRHASTSRAQK
jgi:Protein of unknown function (DUF1018)